MTGTCPPDAVEPHGTALSRPARRPLDVVPRASYGRGTTGWRQPVRPAQEPPAPGLRNTHLWGVARRVTRARLFLPTSRLRAQAPLIPTEPRGRGLGDPVGHDRPCSLLTCGFVRIRVVAGAGFEPA